MEKQIVLTMNQYHTIKWMQTEKQESVNVSDRSKYLPTLSQRGFFNVMRTLTDKGLIAKESQVIKDTGYVYFVGYYLTELGKSLKLI